MLDGYIMLDVFFVCIRGSRGQIMREQCPHHLMMLLLGTEISRRMNEPPKSGLDFIPHRSLLQDRRASGA